MSESSVEQAALNWLCGLGYEVLFGPTIAPGDPAAERTDYKQVSLFDRLRTKPEDSLDREKPPRPFIPFILFILSIPCTVMNPYPASLQLASTAGIVSLPAKALFGIIMARTGTGISCVFTRLP